MKVSKCIKIVGGKEYSYYMVTHTVNGVRRRKFFKTKSDANDYATEVDASARKYGAMSATLSAEEYAIACNVFDRLREMELSPSTATIAVEKFIESVDGKPKDVSINVVFNEYLDKFDKKQDVQIALVKKNVGRFVSKFDARMVASITEKECEQFVKSLGDYAKKTINNTINYTKTFTKWCMDKKYIKSDPFANIKKLREEYKDPEFIKVDVLSDFLHAIESCEKVTPYQRKILLPYFAISFFCGVRSSEICRLSPDAVHTEDESPFIRISTAKGAAKGVKGRIVDMEDNAKHWLQKYPLVQKTEQHKIESIKIKLFAIPEIDVFKSKIAHNAGRHSYITYHVAKYRDCAKTESYAGTSAAMRVHHYQGLATTLEANRYFNIYPL